MHFRITLCYFFAKKYVNEEKLLKFGNELVLELGSFRVVKHHIEMSSFFLDNPSVLSLSLSYILRQTTFRPRSWCPNPPPLGPKF